MAKDLFSAQADDYAKYRPSYPQELFDYILGFVNGRDAAWDCATGNGQAAAVLAHYFSTVDATDISEAQLRNAVQNPNIRYQKSTAENTPFDDDSFDLITIATAYHWLDWTAFHAEATRVGRSGCVVAAWAYNLVRCTDEAVNRVIHRFYFDTVHPFWDKERRHVENAYRDVAFDFSPLPEKEFVMAKQWTRQELLGYIATWSAAQNFQRQTGNSPLPLLEEALSAVWNEEAEREFHFPLFLRLGRTEK